MAKATIPANKKMKLSDLQPKLTIPGVRQNIEWEEIEKTLGPDCDNLLGQSLVLNQLLIDADILNQPGVDKEFVINAMKNIANDTVDLSTKLGPIRTKLKQQKYCLKEPEDILMGIIELQQEATEWIDRYINTVQVNIDELRDYIREVNQKNQQTETTGE